MMIVICISLDPRTASLSPSAAPDLFPFLNHSLTAREALAIKHRVEIVRQVVQLVDVAQVVHVIVLRVVTLRPVVHPVVGRRLPCGWVVVVWLVCWET